MNRPVACLSAALFSLAAAAQDSLKELDTPYVPTPQVGQGRRDGQAATMPAKPANAATGDRLAGKADGSVIGHRLEVGRKLSG